VVDLGRVAHIGGNSQGLPPGMFDFIGYGGNFIGRAGYDHYSRSGFGQG
jgi:hypothetical protein